MINRHAIVVEIIVDAEDDEVTSIAENFAEMAILYKSIGAESSKIVSVRTYRNDKDFQ